MNQCMYWVCGGKRRAQNQTNNSSCPGLVTVMYRIKTILFNILVVIVIRGMGVGLGNYNFNLDLLCLIKK